MLVKPMFSLVLDSPALKHFNEVFKWLQVELDTGKYSLLVTPFVVNSNPNKKK